MREYGALGEVAPPRECQRFMESSQFLPELHTNHEPGRDCPVAARQGPPRLEMGPVRWPSSRCEEVCWVRWFMERKAEVEFVNGDAGWSEGQVAADRAVS
jgi:hypothetical protein